MLAHAKVSVTIASFFLVMALLEMTPSVRAQDSPPNAPTNQDVSLPAPPPPRPQRPDSRMPESRIAPTSQPNAAPSATQSPQPQVVEPKTPTHLFSIEPIDLLLFGTVNVEYELILGDLVGLAIGGRARILSPFGGQFEGHSLRFAPRINIIGSKEDAVSFIGARFDYTMLTSNQRCEGDFVDFCGGDFRDGYAVGGFAGANVLFGEAFFGTLAVGLSYSSLDNPEWTLFNPDFRFLFKADPNLSGDLKPKGRWIPYLRLAVGFYL